MSNPRTVRRDDVTAKARLAITGGMSQAEVVQFLRQYGLNKIDSLIAIHNLYGIDLDEAKCVVHESPAWRDRKSADEHLHEELMLAADLLSSEQQRIAG
jgi:ribosomal protein L7/L12